MTPVDAGPEPREGALRALAATLALVVAAAVGVAAVWSPDDTGPSLPQVSWETATEVLGHVETRTSTPDGVIVATGVGPAGPTLSALDLAALRAGDDVPATGGHTDLIRRYFGPHTVEAIVIVQCESTFDPDAVGTNTNGTQDHGLFQINDIHRPSFEVVTGRSWDERYDPEVNTAFAAWLFDRAGGWGPWRCNRNLYAFDDTGG